MWLGKPNNIAYRIPRIKLFLLTFVSFPDGQYLMPEHLYPFLQSGLIYNYATFHPLIFRKFLDLNVFLSDEIYMMKLLIENLEDAGTDFDEIFG